MYYLTKQSKLLKEKPKVCATTRFGNIFKQLLEVELKQKKYSREAYCKT